MVEEFIIALIVIFIAYVPSITALIQYYTKSPHILLFVAIAITFSIAIYIVWHQLIMKLFRLKNRILHQDIWVNWGDTLLPATFSLTFTSYFVLVSIFLQQWQAWDFKIALIVSLPISLIITATIYMSFRKLLTIIP